MFNKIYINGTLTNMQEMSKAVEREFKTQIEEKIGTLMPKDFEKNLHINLDIELK